jgi:hypothetical protein
MRSVPDIAQVTIFINQRKRTRVQNALRGQRLVFAVEQNVSG